MLRKIGIRCPECKDGSLVESTDVGFHDEYSCTVCDSIFVRSKGRLVLCQDIGKDKKALV